MGVGLQEQFQDGLHLNSPGNVVLPQQERGRTRESTPYRRPSFDQHKRLRESERRQSSERRKSLERRKSMERRQSLERRASIERRKSRDQRKSLERRQLW